MEPFILWLSSSTSNYFTSESVSHGMKSNFIKDSGDILYNCRVLGGYTIALAFLISSLERVEVSSLIPRSYGR